MESEENSDQAGNRCEWCGMPSGTDEYCCKKCKHEHTKAQHTLLNITKNAVVSVRQRLRVDADLRLAFLFIGVVWLIFQGLSIWLMRVNEIYMLTVEHFPQIVLQCPESVIPKTIARLLAFILRLVPASVLMVSNDWGHGITSLLIVCILSTAVNFWFGPFSFVANCVVLLVGVGCMILLPFLSSKQK